MNFGTKLRMARESIGKSRNELAAAVNVTYWTISKYEQNEREPDFKTLTKIAKYLGVSTDHLLDNDPIEETVQTIAAGMTAEYGNQPSEPFKELIREIVREELAGK